MTQHFPIVIEREANGSVSAWVVGLPGVYAAANTPARAKSAIRAAVTAHLNALARLRSGPAVQNGRKGGRSRKPVGT